MFPSAAIVTLCWGKQKLKQIIFVWVACFMPIILSQQTKIKKCTKFLIFFLKNNWIFKMK